MTDLAVVMSIYYNDNLEFVKESIQSILDQTFSQFHLYLIYDGPVKSDVESYVSGLQDNRILLTKFPQNLGLATVLNSLLKDILNNPDYKFIARMDADDISIFDRFEKQRYFLINNADIACVGSWFIEIDENGKRLAYRKLPLNNEDIRNYYFKRAPFPHPSVMYRRELIETAGFYPTDTIFLEDNVLWGNALSMGLKFANIPEYLLKFRIDKDFFKRRTGVKYGWNFIINRFRINRKLNAPLSTYLYLFLNGTIRMMPPNFFKFLYMIARFKS